MKTKATVRQLAEETRTDPNFLLKMLKEAGLPHAKLDDIIELQDKSKVRDILLRPRKTLKRSSFRNDSLQKHPYKKRKVLGEAPSSGGEKRFQRQAIKSGDGRTKDSSQPHKKDLRDFKKRKNNLSSPAAKRSLKTHVGFRTNEHKKSVTPPSTHKTYSKPDAHKPDERRLIKDKKPKSKLGFEMRDKEEKATQRYGVKISVEDALEISEVIKKQNVKDLSFSENKTSNIKKGEIKIENPHKFVKPISPIIKEISILDDLNVNELANKLAIKKETLLLKLKKLGITPNEEETIDKETALLVSEELGYKVKASLTQKEELAQFFKLPQDAKYQVRPPIVTVMGHVDHGKTTLLDYIRKSNQAETESGKITQHFGAYSVIVGKERITFFDTPGHAAFSEMRARGARLTDLVVLVVAADDGVKPQTVEAIKHVQASNAEIIVAINKTDLPEANSEQIRKDIAGYGIQSEEWGGDVQFVEVSAKSGAGVDKLLNSIIAQASVMDIKAAVNIPGQGNVIESKLDKSMGPSVTVILQHGQIKRNDTVVAGSYYGNVKAMKDDKGSQINLATAATPVNILGIKGVPQAGDSFLVVKNEKQARHIVEMVQNLESDTNIQPNLKDMDITKILESTELEMRKIGLIIKTDVTGSLEAIRAMVAEVKSERSEFNIISSGVGAISASDINLAKATGTIIIGFNVRLDPAAKQAARQAPVPEVHYFNIIYELAEQLNKALSEDAALQDVDKIVGTALVKEVFRAKKFGQIAGCEVTEGIVFKDKPIRVLRDNKVIYEGVLESLRRFKENVKEVHSGVECGIGVKDYKNVKAGDQIEVYEKL